jgi:diaminopropionate ammonia-lyase
MKKYLIGYVHGIKNEHKCLGKGPEFLSEESTKGAHRIHKALEIYKPTPLVRLDGMAKSLGVKAIFVKDESQRFGLNAFKGLGGLYALICIVCKKLGLDMNTISFSDLQKPEWKEKLKGMVFVTATDGNHGKGVAWAAGQLGCEAHVYMPSGSSELRAEAIRRVGQAEVRIMETGYDDTVRYAAQMAEKNGWFLVQDTSWEGYEEIPKYIIQGYTTMAEEAVSQLKEAGFETPTHVFLQAGVGAMAGGVLGYLTNRYEGMRPIVSIVEPENIACIYRSAQVDDGEPHPAENTAPTIMAGLNCGEPCTVTWPILRDFADWYLSCPDYVSAYGMRLLAAPAPGDRQVISGESGAVTTGLLNVIAGKEGYGGLKDMLGLNENSVVLLFSTEGDTDPVHYKKVVYEGKDAMPF